ncbi:MAG: ABC transporter substrate-binding protein [Cellulosilyticaceae bacterium]
MKIKQLAMIVLASTVVLGGCSTPEVEKPVVETQTPKKEEAAAFPVTFTDSLGVEVTVAEEPQRIVSLAPSTTEILYFLGVEEKIVGRTKYCSYPESLSEVAEIGGTSDPNVEAVIDLNPDLVVASTHTSEEVMAKLREVGIPVAFLNEQESVEGTYSAIENIGLLIGAQTKAEEVVESMKASIAATTEKVKKATEGKELPKVYYMMWYGDSDSTAGGDTFIGELIRLAGGKNIAEDVMGWSITKEVIAEQDPDIIIVPTGNGIAEAIVDAPFYKDLRAVKEGKVFEIDKDMISRQAPRIADVFEDLAMIIHPEIN